MRSIRIAVYCAIVIAFARKILAKVSKPPRKEKRYYYDCTPKHALEMTHDWNFDIPVGNMSPRGLADAIAVALGVPKDRFRLIGGETPDSVQVAFKDKNLAEFPVTPGAFNFLRASQKIRIEITVCLHLRLTPT